MIACQAARTVLLARLQRKLEQHNVLLVQRADIPHLPLFVASATPATTQMGQADLIVKHVALASFLAQAMPRALTALQVDIKIMAQKEVALFAPLVALMLQRGRIPRASFARLERLRPQMEKAVSPASPAPTPPLMALLNACNAPTVKPIILLEHKAVNRALPESTPVESVISSVSTVKRANIPSLVPMSASTAPLESTKTKQARHIVQTVWLAGTPTLESQHVPIVALVPTRMSQDPLAA